MSSPPRPHGGATVAVITIGEAECGILFCTIFDTIPPNWLVSCDNDTLLGPLDQPIDKTFDHSYGCIIFVCRNLDNLYNILCYYRDQQYIIGLIIECAPYRI